MISMTKLASVGAMAATGAFGTAVIAQAQSDSHAAKPSGQESVPFQATARAATGREVPASVPQRYADLRAPRVVGADPSTGQEYAFSSGTQGHCLIAVRSPGVSGFEVCGPDLPRDNNVVVALGGGKVRTVVVQADASTPPPAARSASESKVIAPGVWITESAGELPGG